MLSLVEVKCPHCQMRGQIMVPPLGALVLGPCPQCHELLVVFCGRVLPLDKDIMMDGTDDEKHAHLMEVLTQFLGERVYQLLENSPELSEEIRKQVGATEDSASTAMAMAEEASQPIEVQTISQHEVEQFLNVDLKLLDDKDYFNSVFGSAER